MQTLRKTCLRCSKDWSGCNRGGKGGVDVPCPFVRNHDGPSYGRAVHDGSYIGEEVRNVVQLVLKRRMILPPQSEVDCQSRSWLPVVLPIRRVGPAIGRGVRSLHCCERSDVWNA